MINSITTGLFSGRRSTRRVLVLTAALVVFGGLATTRTLGQPQLIMYFPGWNTNTYPYTLADYSQMTHIAHAFLYANADGSLDTTSDFRYNPPLIQAAHMHGVKIVVSIGGSGDPAFRTMVSDPTARSNFVAKLTAFCLSNNYDGVDYDWESPTNATDRANFTSVVQQTRAAFNATNPPLSIVSATVKPTSSGGQWVDVSQTEDYLDWYGVRTYNYYTDTSSKSGLTSPIYQVPGDSFTDHYVDASIQYYESRGVPLTELYAGILFHGYQFSCTNLFAPTNGPNSAIVYSNAVIDLSNGWTRVWNSPGLVPYLVDPGHTQLITYEDPLSIQYKCDYIVGQRLGGTIVWMLSDGMYQGASPLLDVMSVSLLGRTNVDTFLDTFEGATGNFHSTPTASPSTAGISSSSSATLTTAAAHSGTNSLLVVLKDDSSSSSDWAVRFLSNGGEPTGQLNLGTNGYVGFWLKTGSTNLSVGVAVHDSDGIERSVTLPVVNDGNWYRYEWNLAGGPSQWNAWSNGNGVVDGPVVTLDSIWFYAPNNSKDRPFYLDDVYVRNPVTRVGASVAEAGSNQTVTASNNVFHVTLSGNAFSSRLLQWLTYQWTQVAGPSVTLANPTNLVATFAYTGAVYTNTALQFQLTVDDGLFTSNDVTTVTLLPTDSVGDGICDWWRQQYFGGDGTTTNSRSCATCDPDGDGLNNLQESLGGTNPTNSASGLRIISAALTGDDVYVAWRTAGGHTNVVQATDGTTDGGYVSSNFTDIPASQTIVTGSGDALTNYMDVGGATNAPTRYYRLRLVP